MKMIPANLIRQFIELPGGSFIDPSDIISIVPMSKTDVSTLDRSKSLGNRISIAGHKTQITVRLGDDINPLVVAKGIRQEIENQMELRRLFSEQLQQGIQDTIKSDKKRERKETDIEPRT